MSCYKYWGKIEEIADKLSSYGDLDNEGLSALDGTDIDEITMILDEIEVIAHDKVCECVEAVTRWQRRRSLSRRQRPLTGDMLATQKPGRDFERHED